MSEYTRVERYELLTADVAGMSKKDAVDTLLEAFPHNTRSFIERNLKYLQQLDPVALKTKLMYSDPTGDAAVREVMKEAA